MSKNFAGGIAEKNAKTQVGQKGLGFYNDVLKITDDEVAKSVAKKALKTPDSEIGTMFKDLEEAGLNVKDLSPSEMRGIYTGAKREALDKASIKENMTEEAIKKARNKNQRKADRSWNMNAAGDYFGNSEDGFNNKRIAAAGAAIGGTYVAGSVLNRAVGPGTLTRDEYGNRDIVGIPFI